MNWLKLAERAVTALERMAAAAEQRNSILAHEADQTAEDAALAAWYEAEVTNGRT